MKIYKTHKVKMPTTAVTSNSTEMNPIGRCGIDFFYFGSVLLRFFSKKSVSVRNEFGSAPFK